MCFKLLKEERALSSDCVRGMALEAPPLRREVGPANGSTPTFTLTKTYLCSLCTFCRSMLLFTICASVFSVSASKTMSKISLKTSRAMSLEVLGSVSSC